MCGHSILLDEQTEIQIICDLPKVTLLAVVEPGPERGVIANIPASSQVSHLICIFLMLWPVFLSLLFLLHSALSCLPKLLTKVKSCGFSYEVMPLITSLNLQDSLVKKMLLTFLFLNRQTTFLSSFPVHLDFPSP